MIRDGDTLRPGMSCIGPSRPRVTAFHHDESRGEPYVFAYAQGATQLDALMRLAKVIRGAGFPDVPLREVGFA